MSRRKGPDFISIGLQKTASNWLYFNLNQHRGIKPLTKKGYNFFYFLYFKNKHPLTGWLYLFFDHLKEFFKRELRLIPLHIQFLRSDYTPDQYLVWQEMMKNRMRFYFSLRKNKKWYEGFFDKDDRLMGEFANNYSRLTDKEISLIKTYYPELKVILIIREPVDRFFSVTSSHFRKNRLSTAKFTAEIEKTIKHEQSVLPIDVIKKWSAHFDSNQLYVGFYDDVKNSPYDTYLNICSFLGISTDLDREYSLKVIYRGGIKNVLKQRGDHSKVKASPEAFITQHVNNSSTVLPDTDPEFVSRLIEVHEEGIQELSKEVASDIPTRWLQAYQEFRQHNSVSN